MILTATVHDGLYARALKSADPKMGAADLFQEGLKAFVRVRAAQHLATLGGSVSEMQDVLRRKPSEADPPNEDQ